MNNEFGAKLDRNGYAPSVLDHGGECFVCGRTLPLQRHEVFHGANRQKSKALGLWVNVCPACHERIHAGREGLDGLLKHRAYETALAVYGWRAEDFRARFGRSY